MHHYSHTKYYFINKFDTKIISKIDSDTILIFRNYELKKSNETLLLKIKKYCNQRRIKFYLSNNIKLAIKLDLDGAYIPSFNHSFEHLNYSFKRNFKIIGSAHNLKQIKIKEIQKVKGLSYQDILMWFLLCLMNGLLTHISQDRKIIKFTVVEHVT